MTTDCRTVDAIRRTSVTRSVADCRNTKTKRKNLMSVVHEKEHGGNATSLTEGAVLLLELVDAAPPVELRVAVSELN